MFAPFSDVSCGARQHRENTFLHRPRHQQKAEELAEKQAAEERRQLEEAPNLIRGFRGLGMAQIYWESWNDVAADY